MTLNISCKENYVIHLVRANYGRLSVGICNPQAKIDMSVNCMSWKSHLIMERKCMNKPSCSVQVSAKNFDDPCPGTIKYLEVQYNCTLASLAVPSTTTPLPPPVLEQRNASSNGGAPSSLDEGGDLMDVSSTTGAPLIIGGNGLGSTTRTPLSATGGLSTQSPLLSLNGNRNMFNGDVDGGNRNTDISVPQFPSEETVESSDYDGNQPGAKTLYCAPTTSRGLHWNLTRAGKAFVQKCPGGATGFARWHCDPSEIQWIPERRPDLKQ